MSDLRSRLEELLRVLVYSDMNRELFRQYLHDESLEGWDDARSELATLEVGVAELLATERSAREATGRELKKWHDRYVDEKEAREAAERERGVAIRGWEGAASERDGLQSRLTAAEEALRDIATIPDDEPNYLRAIKAMQWAALSALSPAKQ